jgi:Tol biopolymer transport system component
VPIDPDHWEQIEQVYHAALERAPGLRGAFLAEACKGDQELQREVEALLTQEGSRPGPAGQPTQTIVVPGAQLGPYKIEELIGAGGMGQVFRAVDTRLGREVAVKVSAAQFSERFEREARAISALNHPHICTLHDVGPNYLVMELVEGAPLKGPLPLGKAVEYASQILDALDAAHRKGITHRDLKPANILLTKNGVKLLDFGLAHVERGANDPALTAAGMVMGTPAYMAPEQWEGKPADARSDLYSFGCVLYEMLTGKRAAKGRTPVEPVALDRVISTCLAQDPDDRFQTARDAKRALGWAQEPQPAPSRSHPRMLAWVVATALAAGLLGVSWVAWRATRPVDRPLMRFSADLGPEAVEGPSITAAISPDGTRLAFVARGPGGKEQLATRPLDQAQATLLAGTENAADPFFSPDGQWIGFFADGKMKKISVQGGAAVALCDAPGPSGASWGEDGSIIISNLSIPGFRLSRVPAAGGTPQAITKPSEKGELVHLWPQILPGGQAALFTGDTVAGGYEDANIEVLSLKTGQWKAVQRGGYFGRYVPTSNGAGHLVYVHQGTLFAVGFDLDRLEVRGTPAPLLDDVAGNAATGGGQFDVARNGTLAYLSGKSRAVNLSWPVAWMDSTGKTQPLLATPGLYFNPRFSPDGKRLALAVGPFTRGDIQLYDWQRDTMTRLTFAQRALAPVWTPDGRHIVFYSQAPGRFSLRWIRADGAGEPQPLLERKDNVFPYSFSADGKRLAFAEFGADAGWDLWTLPLDVSDPEHPKPGKPELFLRTPFAEAEQAFSPDGHWIVYASDESGRYEIYVRPFPGGASSGSGKWQISTSGGRHPIWSRNGRELFYESPDNHIMATAYTANANSFAADKPRLWSNTQILQPRVGGPWDLDLAPDGKRFAVFPRPEATGEQKGSVHVTVLLNFFDEVQRRTAAGGK